ncbi:hypothetical protein [Nitrospira moscoviensis]|uniref:Uncharacterized protein n=1 Tax=Nitrospira moscoviensis TaxID=42253 RepID=A0A0K2GHT8_NITMO|nr:hypothetical protein [Nitrospira moscoviensis]ALA60197.1 hypothetical protein NITMOv2_3807 [Nitrospira moscoviensis]
MSMQAGPIVSGVDVERRNAPVTRVVRRSYNGSEKQERQTIELDLHSFGHPDFVAGDVVSIRNGLVIPLDPGAIIPFAGIILGVVQNGAGAYCADLIVRGALDDVTVEGGYHVGSRVYARREGERVVFTTSSKDAALVGELLYRREGGRCIVGFRRADDTRSFRCL